MGEVIELEARRRAAPAAAAPTRAELFFDLGSPSTYLAAERADRSLAALIWTPVDARELPGEQPRDLRRSQREAEHRAAVLRLPLVWPEKWPAAVPSANRVAALACERGRGGPFVLAAARLAFAGGFDLEDPEILGVAVAAARLEPTEAAAAARDARRDDAARDRGRRLRAHGVARLPAILVGPALFSGEARLAEAIAAARSARAAERSA